MYLQDQQFSRLGRRSVIKVDVRILAATNINIPEALANKRLREDLYYRLNAFTLQLPPLRERKEEIPILLKHLMTRMAERYARPPLPLSPALLKACHDHIWPGNFRELNNFLKRYLILETRIWRSSNSDPKMTATAVLRNLPRERTAIAADRNRLLGAPKMKPKPKPFACLEQTNWNRSRLPRSYRSVTKPLLYKIRQYGIAEAKSHHRLSADISSTLLRPPRLPDTLQTRCASYRKPHPRLHWPRPHSECAA